jgi:hypothetical protein
MPGEKVAIKVRAGQREKYEGQVYFLVMEFTNKSQT